MEVCLQVLLLCLALQLTNSSRVPRDQDELEPGFLAVDQTLQNNPSWLTPGLKKLVSLLKRGQRGAVQALLNEDTSINLSHGLFFAAQLGDAAMVEELVARGAEVGVAEVTLGDTALMVASQLGHTEVVRTLLEAGAPTQSQDIYGLTALHKAANRGRLEVVKVLLAASADPNLQSELGNTPLNNRLHNLPEALELTKTLLGAGADPNLPDYSQRTALHNAATVGRLEVVKVLVEAGAEVEARDRHGDTARGLASDFGHREVESFLGRRVIS